jgi:hypothetical protein
MSTLLSRRSLLAGLGATAISTAIVASHVAQAATADPAFAAIERHRAAELALSKAADEEEAARERCLAAGGLREPRVILFEGGKPPKEALERGFVPSPPIFATSHEDIAAWFASSMGRPFGMSWERDPVRLAAMQARHDERVARKHAEMDAEIALIKAARDASGLTAAEAALEQAHEVERVALEALVATVPQTMAGLLAWVRYADEAEVVEMRIKPGTQDGYGMEIWRSMEQALLSLTAST